MGTEDRGEDNPFHGFVEPPKVDTRDLESPQERCKCACPSWSTARECIRIRYRIERWSSDDFEEECECGCHYDDGDAESDMWDGEF